MTKRMLIDGTHPEEIRVVISDGNRLEEYDIETSTKTQLKGNIYLAKVTRVEPSLQAAFVDYGGGRHGFLAFSEIHPDYYQIPIEDREALKRDLAQLEDKAQAAHAHVDAIDGEISDADGADDDQPVAVELDLDEVDAVETEEPTGDVDNETDAGAVEDADTIEEDRSAEADTGDGTPADAGAEAVFPAVETFATEIGESEPAVEDAPTAAAAPPSKGSERRGNPMRRYKIQEVIKRRQILLVQVVKEERGNKGAALTTYLSLAGRYCVLMPNATRSGGGVSRKITSAADRRRLRDLMKDLNVSDGMGVIMRTAGMARNKSEIKRDFDYLTRLWEDVRALTLESAAPALVYEEGDLIKRAIRDLYARDIEEVFVEGTEAYQAAKKLMRMMMPSHAKRVQPYRDTIPLFHRYQVETQLEAMHNSTVQLKSGGYIVIDATEALVAIDVNSGRSTKERNIEETAVKTNLEAATEIARQLRLRDLAGLIVIDFIDMDENRNQRAVEKRLKESVKIDRARIQLGRISNFGLFELSRQRLRPSIIETSTEACPHCHGAGFIRSTESTALHALRMIEEEGIRLRSSEVSVSVPTGIALYILNQKRDNLIDIEKRYGFKVNILGDDTLIPPDLRIERIKARSADSPKIELPTEIVTVEEEADPEDTEDTEQNKVEQKETGSTRKRRPRRRRKKDTSAPDATDDKAATAQVAAADTDGSDDGSGQPDLSAKEDTAEDTDSTEDRGPRRRRRGRRGGRRRNQRDAKPANGSDSETAAANGNGDTGDTNGSAPSVPGGRPEASVDRTETVQPETAADEKPASVGAAASQAATDGQPRRGWWQRILD